MSDERRGPDLAGRIARLDTSLLPKILGAFVLVLVSASLVTLLLDTRLTRSALRDQSESLLRSQVLVLQKVAVDRANLLGQNLRSAREILVVEDGEAVELGNRLDERMNELARTFGLDVANAFSRDGRLIATAAQSDTVVPPPAALFDSEADTHTRVVPLTDGSYAQVVTAIVGRAPNEVMLVGGKRFDSGMAYEFRDAVGERDITLFTVDGAVISAAGAPLESLDPLDPPSTADELGDEPQTRVVDLRGQQTFVRFGTVAAADDLGWGRYAALGVAIPEPLASLDQALLRNRVMMIVLLIATAAVLAWVVTSIVTRPLINLSETASAIASGDLDASFGAATNDEIGILSSSLERMRRVLRAQLHVIRRQAALLQDAARRVVAAQDDERRRLARDLHDGVQQQLVMLRLRVGFARARLRSDPDALDDVTADLGAEIDRIIEGLRETGQDIFPSILQDRGLQGALFSLAGRTSIPIDVSAAPDPLPRFEQDLEANAYFLASEAVTNALKHARARRIEVEARLVGDELRLTISDDGRGFDLERVPRSSGLNHMNDRASAVGGTLRVRSGVGQGTTVTATIPVSVPGSLEEEEDRGDPTVEVDLLR